MNIIIDTREQLPLCFTGHWTERRKLDEGDYNTPELEAFIVIERKSMPDLYQSITSDHARFKKEILRAKAKNKTFYIFIEGDLENFYSMKWSERKLNNKASILKKIITTMVARYDLKIVECENREIMVTRILETIENEKNKRRSE